MPKNVQTSAQLLLISHASKVMLKILQAKFQQYVNRALPDVQAGFRKGRGTRNQTANIRWITEKAREFQKSMYVSFILSFKPFILYWHITDYTNQRSNCQHLLDHRKSKRIPEKHLLLLY